MAFKARLNFIGKEYHVPHSAYPLCHDAVINGNPTSLGHGHIFDAELHLVEDLPNSYPEVIEQNQVHAKVSFFQVFEEYTEHRRVSLVSHSMRQLCLTGSTHLCHVKLN